MTDYTIGENFVLPSKGKIYDVDVNPNVKIRTMTTIEEMKRIAATDHPYKNMCEIIDACLIDDPGISSYDMHIGDYEFLLHKLRIVTYGPQYTISNTCVYCGCETTDTINLDELPSIDYTEEFDTYKEFDLPKSGNHIELRIQTPRMLDEVAQELKEYKKKVKNNFMPDPSLLMILSRLIKTIDGKMPNPLKVEDWIKQLPMIDTNTILAHAEKMNESLGVDTHLTCECNVCGLSFQTTVKNNNEFFRPNLNI